MESSILKRKLKKPCKSNSWLSKKTLPKMGFNQMKHVMKSLKHNGIFVPLYDYKGFSIKIQGQTIKLSEKTEPMAMAWNAETYQPPYRLQTPFLQRTL